MNSGSKSRPILLILCGLALGALAAEVVLRLSYSEGIPQRFSVGDGETHKIAHPFLPFAGRPNHGYRQFMPELGDFIQVELNSYGFRTHELPEEKHPEDYFVVCLGESTTWGYIAESNETTWPELLEKRLRERYPNRNIRVFNLGIEGGSLPYSVVALATVGTHLRPDLVISYHGFNDYGPLTAASFRTDYAHHYVDVHPERLRRGLLRSMPGWMRSSYAATFLAGWVDDVRGVNSLAREGQRELGDMVDDPAAATHRMVPYLRTIDAIARGRGGQALFSTFQFFAPDSEQARLMNSTLRETFETNGWPYVDQDRLIPDGDRSLQVDAAHFTRKGRELVAQNFFDEIVKQGWIDGGSATDS